MKNILLLVHDDAGQEARLQAALDLTRSLQGHLHCVDVCQPPVAIAYEVPEANAMLLEEERVREEAHRAVVEQQLTKEDVSWSMTKMLGDISVCIEDQVGLSDVIVLNRRLDDFVGPDMLAISSTVVLKSGKPIVAVGEGSNGFNVAGNALVAWDGSDAAMAALVASVPLLSLAGRVLLVEVSGSSLASLEEAAAYLSRHEIHARIDLIELPMVSDASVATVIQSICDTRDIDYCVMGAYGHSRLRETIFGGVTRAMLESSRVPLFLVH